jgi:ribosomal protein S27E
MRLKSSSLDLELVTGRTIVVPLVWARCGVMGERMRLECPLCGRRVCILYHLNGRVACRRCNGLWYAAQRTSSYGRRVLAKRKLRRKLGDYGQLWAAKYPPKPRGMWRRTYARHCAALARIERERAP